VKAYWGDSELAIEIRVGDRVRILAGPYANRMGVCYGTYLDKENVVRCHVTISPILRLYPLPGECQFLRRCPLK